MTSADSPAARAEALEPCPACARSLDLHENDWCEPPEWHACCAGCGLHFRASSVKETAIAYANCRPALDAQARLIEEAREMLFKPVNEFDDATYDMSDGSQSPDRKALISEAKAFLTTLPAKGEPT